MVKSTLIPVFGIVLGVIMGYLIIYNTPLFSKETLRTTPILGKEKQIIGFLPYWLLSKAHTESLKYISTLTYFGLTIDTDGSILKLTNPQEAEPGWHALVSGAANPFLTKAKDSHKDLSLLVFKGNKDTIDELLQDPVAHAKNLMKDVTPVMQKYGFTDLNIDIERVGEASDEARMHFTAFAQEVKKELDAKNLGTLTIEVSGADLIHHNVINIHDIAHIADFVVVMAYDYHYVGSDVAGAVAPMNGAGVNAEYDVKTAITLALANVPAQKLILGVPLYGYAWETIDPSLRTATIPGTGITSSNMLTEALLSSCATCSAVFDTTTKESAIIYKDQDTGTYHEVYFPDSKSTQAKVDFAKSKHLAGLALWALGYEGPDILAPLKNY